MQEDLISPFKEIFHNIEIANWAFDFMKDGAERLGIASDGDPRLAVKYRKDKNGIHFTFCKWLIYGFYRSKRGYIVVRIPLLEQELKGLDNKVEFHIKSPFMSNPTIVTCIFKLSVFNEYRSIILPIYEATLIEAKKQLSNFTSTPYPNEPELSKAIFDPVFRSQLFEKGLESIKTERQPKVWWVNQGSSLKEEVESGIIWAPTGSNNYHWNTLSEVEPGDVVIHYAKGEIKYVSQVISNQVAPKPVEGRDPNEIGTLIRLDYYELQPAIPRDLVARKIFALNLDQGPINRKYYVKQGYLFRFDWDGLDILQSAQPETIWPKYARKEQSKKPFAIGDLCRETGIQAEELKSWLQALKRRGQAILYGPPGTGKTYLAKKMAKLLVSEGDGFVDLVQFHPAYAYEDFVQGIRPENTEDGNLSYTLKSGHFLTFCKEAEQRDGISVLIIDEINRANLARVFGELMYALEYRDEEIVLASGERFKIPKNVRIIGTMNTADRSIALVDHALRRRFAFLNLKPNYESLKLFLEQQDFKADGLIQVLRTINQSIADPNYEIGISFFMVEELELELEAIWKMEIEPYLEEYFFDQPDVVRNYRWDRVREKVYA